jgi:MFS family permease
VRSVLSVLAPPFRGFFLGRLVSLLGSAMTPVALAFAVLNASGRPSDLGIILACQITPQLALLLVGGAAGDRFSRRKVLVAANLGAGLTQGGVAAVLLSGHFSLPLIAALEVGNGVMEAFASPALRGIVPELVRPADVQRANSLLASTQNGAKILGPTVAGLLVVAVGGGWAVGLDALSFIAAALFFIRLPVTSVVPAGRRPGLGADIRAGWHAFRSIRWVSVTALSFCVINLVNVGPWQILGPELTRQRSGEAAWGLVLSVRAVGLLVMSVLMYRIVLRRPLRVSRILGVLSGLPLIALGLRLALPWLMACAFVGALSFTLSGITWDTALQQHVPRELLSRVASFDDLLSYAAIPVGLLLTGPAAARFGSARVALCCGIVYALAAVAPLTVRSVRDLSGGGPEGETGADGGVGAEGEAVPAAGAGPEGAAGAGGQPIAAPKRSPRSARRSGGSLANTSRR